MTADQSMKSSGPSGGRFALLDPLLRDEKRSTLHRLGTVMIVVAVVGLAVSAVGTIAAWHFVGNLDDSSRNSLDATIETLDTVDDSIDLAGSVLTATSATLDTASATLTAVSTSFDDASGVIDEIDGLTETVGPALDQTAATLRRLEVVGTTIDNALEALDDIPFAPNYDGGDGLGTTIGQIATDLEPLPEQFASASTELDGFGTSIDDLSNEVRQLSDDVAEVTSELAGTDDLIAKYHSNIASARAAAVQARDDLTGNAGLVQLLIVIVGLNIAVSQIVPFWLGRALRRSADLGEPDREFDGPALDVLPPPM